MKNQFNFFRKVAPATGIAHTKAISTQRALSESVISAWFGSAHQPPLNDHRPRALSEAEAPSRFARIAAIIALCFAPLLAMAQNTVYIVDNGDNGTDRFLWTQWTAANNALLNGWTLDMSETTPETTQRALDLGARTATIKGDAAKTYRVSISTNANQL